MGLDPGAVARLIYRSCLTLDAEDFEGYLALCAPDFSYRITAYSPEIRKQMIWLRHGREGLAAVFENIPDHVRRLGSLHRHASVYAIDDAGGGLARAVTSLQVTHTGLDGRSRLLAAGHYYDVVEDAAGTPLLREREVRLETRELGAGSHLPI